MDALKAIGLLLNNKKHNFLRYNASEDESSLSFAEIDCKCIKVLSDTVSQKYLGKFHDTSVAERSSQVRIATSATVSEREITKILQPFESQGEIIDAKLIITKIITERLHDSQ